MCTGVAEVEGQGSLPIAPALRFDPGGRSAERIVAIGADDEASDNLVARGQCYGHAAFADGNHTRRVIDPGEVGESARAFRQSSDEMPVLDVPAEGVQADFGGG